MGRAEQITKERLRKVEELKKQGINPYPYNYTKKNNSKELQEKYEKLGKDRGKKDKVSVAGRLLIVRDIGKIIFGKLRDSSGDIQILLQDKKTPEPVLGFFKKYIDSGDFVGVEGTVYRTKRGELSVVVTKIELLSKAILPLPEKWHGLTDKEERYRKRYLDLIMNPEVREVFGKRSRIISLIRKFLDDKGFIEVETPALQPIYGGTNAKPFKTHLNVLDMNVYLRVAPELYLKRLVVGGFEKVYEICKNFRNEGIDYMHNPEFTMIEWYEAYADYNTMMDNAEEMYKFIAKELTGGYIVEFMGRKINLRGKWERMIMTEAIKKHVKIDVEKMSVSELGEFIEENKIEYRGEKNKGILINAVFEKLVTEKLDGPVWIIDYPKEVSPLAKPHRDKEGYVERFECYVGGKEIGDGWSEIINPADQKQRFEREQASLRAGNDEAMPMDKDFINSLEYGMPVLGGIGIGIDRLVMFFCNQNSIREVIFFPFMKPSSGEKEDKLKGGKNG
jgi:lysyl-tRNA synthetase class 2